MVGVVVFNWDGVIVIWWVGVRGVVKILVYRIDFMIENYQVLDVNSVKVEIEREVGIGLIMVQE